MTSVHDQLFVLRKPCKQLVQVYDTETFTLQRLILINQLYDDYKSPCRLASCAISGCLYVCHCNRNSVYRVELSPSNDVSAWKVGAGPVGLSVTSSCNVLVTCRFADNKIQEYTPHGSLLRKICLQSNEPLHAVQLSSGQFVVSDVRSDRSIILVDSAGLIVFSSPAKLFNHPGQLAVLKNNGILVADRDNNRIVLLNPTLNKSRVIPLPAVMNGPWTVLFDESRGRLYVGEWKGGRVLVFDNVINIEPLMD